MPEAPVKIEANMTPSASVSPVREILEERLAHLLRELEQVFDEHISLRVVAEVEEQVAQRSAEAGERARRVLADQLNQAMRRIRRASDAVQLAATLIDAAGAYASGVALLRISGSTARGDCIRGVPPETAAAFHELEIPLDSAPALAEAVRSHDPVTALPEETQISPRLRSLVGEQSGVRIFLCPIVAGERVPACLMAWGNVQASALEVLTQLAAAVWSTLPSAADLVTIGKAEGAGRTAWDALSSEEQRVHLRAQRFARVQVAELRLFHPEAVETGRAARDLSAALGPRLDIARELFRNTFFEICPSMVDYFHLEVVHTLANDDPEVLGKDYPGPLV
jgi:hypothetical protein